MLSGAVWAHVGPFWCSQAIEVLGACWAILAALIATGSRGAGEVREHMSSSSSSSLSSPHHHRPMISRATYQHISFHESVCRYSVTTRWVTIDLRHLSLPHRSRTSQLPRQYQRYDRPPSSRQHRSLAQSVTVLCCSRQRRSCHLRSIQLLLSAAQTPQRKQARPSSGHGGYLRRSLSPMAKGCY